MNFQKYLSNIFVTPLFDDQKFYDPPSGATMLKKHVTPNARSAENMHFWGYFTEQIFIKICSHPIISCDPPISHEKILWPPAFSWPPYLEENDSPLDGWMGLEFTKDLQGLWIHPVLVSASQSPSPSALNLLRA